MSHAWRSTPVLLACAVLCAGSQPVLAQHGDGHDVEVTGHTRTTLFAAEMSAIDPLEVAEPIAGTGTGAFVLAVDGAEATLTYDLTYEGLAAEAARGIALRNAGEGGDGEVVHRVCGGGSGACPAGAGATVRGEWTSDDALPLTPEMVREIAAGRVYLEIDAGGDAALRAQLVTSRLMVPARGHVARLRPMAEGAAGASGTGALFVTFFPDGTQMLDYHVTVTGLSSPVEEARLVSAAESVAARSAPAVLRLSVDPGARESRGGTISGGVGRGSPETRAIAAPMIDLARGALSLVITTRDNAEGELFALVEPLD